MKLTAQIKLLPSSEQADVLLRTMETANAACNAISEVAWESKSFRQYDLHHACYHDIRDRFALSAQVVVRCLGKVADAYKVDQKVRREFRPHGAVAYDDRILRYSEGEVSIWTMSGRERIPFVVGEHHARLLRHRKGESDLVYRGGQFFLLATCDLPDTEEQDADGWLGVDLGIVQVAVTSSGDAYSGAGVEEVRDRYQATRRSLQAKGTKGAKRTLRRLRGRERRFQTSINHAISRRIVDQAKAEGKGVRVEDLSGIRNRIRVRKAQRYRRHRWAFHQLRQFLEYKCALAGVPFEVVDARYTSRRCPVCGHTEKANRKSQSEFRCRSCGLEANADCIGALNISLGGVCQPPHEVALVDVEAIPHVRAIELRRRAVTSHPL